VVLSHPRSGIGKLTEQTVDLVATLTHFTPETIARIMPGKPDDMETEQIVALIERDLAFHERRA